MQNELKIWTENVLKWWIEMKSIKFTEWALLEWKGEEAKSQLICKGDCNKSERDDKKEKRQGKGKGEWM